jgi:LysR family transcriptional regulator of gallate degradation
LFASPINSQIRWNNASRARAILLPQASARFARIYPMASVEVVEGPYMEVLASLREGAIDVLVGAIRDPVPVADVAQEPLLVDDPVIVERASHPLLSDPGLPLPDYCIFRG